MFSCHLHQYHFCRSRERRLSHGRYARKKIETLHLFSRCVFTSKSNSNMAVYLLPQKVPVCGSLARISLLVRFRSVYITKKTMGAHKRTNAFPVTRRAGSSGRKSAFPVMKGLMELYNGI